MADQDVLLSTFGSGEISPLLVGRVDMTWYPNACQRMRNFLALTEGVATRRPPTRFVAEIKDSTKVAAIRRFQFSSAGYNAYEMEFGDGTIRFFQNKGAVVNPQNVVGAADNGTGLIRLQISDTSGLYTGNVMTVSGVGGTVEANGTWTITLIDSTHVDLQGSAFANAYTTGGTTSTIVEVPAPYAAADVALLMFVRSADVIFIFHSSYTPQMLTRAGHTRWTIADVPFVDGPYLEVNTENNTLTPSATTGAITVTALNTNGINVVPGGTYKGFLTTDVGRMLRIGHVPNDWTASHAYAVGDVVKNGANGVYICRVAGTSAASGGPTGTTLTIGDHQVVWDYVNAGGIYYGYVLITGYTDNQHVSATVLQTLVSTSATKYFRLGLYCDTLGYPACGDLWQQRLEMAGAPGAPDRIDASRVADYTNMAPGDADDDPIADTLGLAGTDAIRWLDHKRTSFAGSSGSAIKVYGGQGYDSPVTPSSIQTVEQTDRGAAQIAPVRVVNGLIYVHRQLRKLLELYYDFTLDVDTATELTARCRHLTIGGLAELTYQAEPFSILWAPRSDGKLFALGYYREQQFLAASMHTLGGGGVVESVSTMPGTYADELWMIVRRTINGVTRRYVEVMDDFAAVEDAAEAQSVPDSELFFGDCYAVYDGAPASVISGLDYLEGLAVVVNADGVTITGLTVQSGEITLPTAAAKVYVGLDYSDTSELKPMPIEAGAQMGSPKAQMKRIGRLSLGLYRSGRFYVGDGIAAPELQSVREVADNMDDPVPLKTEVYEVPDFPGDMAREVNISVQPYACEPLTIRWLAARLNTEEG